MNPTGRLPQKSTDQLLTSQLAAYADAFRHHLTERRYASRTIDVYVACLAVFALWMSRSRLDIDRIDEDAVQRFLDDHRLQCKSASPGRRKYCNLHAALGVIALWLGHESTTTTHRYVEANLEMKAKALARLQEPDTKMRRYRPPDDLMKFLQAL